MDDATVVVVRAAMRLDTNARCAHTKIAESSVTGVGPGRRKSECMPRDPRTSPDVWTQDFPQLFLLCSYGGSLSRELRSHHHHSRPSGPKNMPKFMEL